MTTLHPQLAQDCLVVGNLPLCTLLLMKDSNYPWFILVPNREAISEIYQLSEHDQIQLSRESSILAQYLASEFRADKINIAALGNIVPQLHIHHIARYKDDKAWPAPVWGTVACKPYNENELEALINQLKAKPMHLLSLAV